MKSFLFGLGLGVGLGILFAPMSGEETRSNLSDRAGDLKNSAREAFDQNRERFQRGMENVRGQAGRAVSSVGERMRGTGTESTGNLGSRNL